MTEVTQAEKREALARWEGWEFCSQGHWYRPVNGSCAEQGGIIDLPDYWNDGNAMLRLLEMAQGTEFQVVIWMEEQWVDVGPGTAARTFATITEMPYAVADALAEAIS